MEYRKVFLLSVVVFLSACAGKNVEQPLYDALHRNGVMCMISVAPTHDRAKTETEKTAGYRSEISTRPDVIETDYPYLFQGLDLTK